MKTTHLEALGWISVKNRLPKHGALKILITNGKYACVSKARILIAFPDVATHWMPIAQKKRQVARHMSERLLKELGNRISDDMILMAEVQPTKD